MLPNDSVFQEMFVLGSDQQASDERRAMSNQDDSFETFFFEIKGGVSFCVSRVKNKA
jgi:hypothetical protein